MKIKFNRALKDYYQKLKKINLCNGLDNYILNEYLLEKYDAISPDLVASYLESHQGRTLEETYRALFYYVLDITREEEEIKELVEHNKFDDFKLLDSKMMTEDEYYMFCSNIDFKNSNNEIKIVSNYYEAYEGFLYDEVSFDNSYYEFNKLGFFKEKINYINLLENDEVWMSVTPYEINTMKKAINNAKGKVLVFGLGLAYYPFMISIKEEVSSIVIVENNEKIINYIKSNLIDKFPHKDKITIIKDDMFSYIKKAKLDDFDYLFVDTYHFAIEGAVHYFDLLPYLNNVKIEYDFWIENSIFLEIRHCLFWILSYNFQKSMKDKYKNFSDVEKKLIDKLSILFDDYVIEKEEDIDNLFSIETIKNKILTGNRDE